MEQVILETITDQRKQLVGKSVQGFIKGKSCQTDLITFSNKITSFVDMGRAVHVVCLDCGKVFDTVSHSLLLDKLTKYTLDWWSVRRAGNWLISSIQRVVNDGFTQAGNLSQVGSPRD